jgi:RNA polymerase sigma-70 factor (ECF subfamily)
MDDVEVPVLAECDFDEYYRRVEPRLRRALVATLGVTDGGDAAAHAMAYAFEHWTRVRAYQNPDGYLYRVGLNSARRRRRPLRLIAAEPADDPRFEPELWHAVRRLPTSQRTAVLLVTAWRYTWREAADVLGVSVSTVRNHHARGMRRLRDEVGGDNDG